MAILALRNNRMFVSVTFYAEKSGMFCSTSFKGASDIFMAGTAIFIGYFFAIGQSQWLMYLVTFYAIGKFLCLCMRLVAIQTIRFKAMFVMAE